MTDEDCKKWWKFTDGLRKKRSRHEICKEFPNKTYAELEKHRETQLLLKHENEELEEKIGIGHNGPPKEEKLLKSKRNDFPERYRVWALEDLIAKNPPNDLTELTEDIKTNGLNYPIVVRSDEKDNPNKPLVQIGNQRVRVAKDLNYTHISGYYSHFEDMDFGGIYHWLIE